MKMSELLLWQERCKHLELAGKSRTVAAQMVVDEARHGYGIAMMENDALDIVAAIRGTASNSSCVRKINLLHCDDVKTGVLLDTPEVKALMATPGCPRVYGRQLDVPDLLVVWDSGEGPHSPEGQEKPDALSMPQAIWDHVGDLVKAQYGTTEVCCVVWLIGNY